MVENNDKLLKQFFANNRQEIADNGFTRRMTHRLPGRSRRLSMIWAAFCFTLALALFISLNGPQLVLDTLRETFNSIIQTEAAEFDLKSLLITTIVLLYLGYRKIFSLA